MRNERLVVSRERLLEEVWGYDPLAMTNTIDVFISNLRRKLEAGGEPRILHTKRGAGYVVQGPAPAMSPPDATPRGRPASGSCPARPLADPLAPRRRLGGPDPGDPDRVRRGRRAARHRPAAERLRGRAARRRQPARAARSSCADGRVRQVRLPRPRPRARSRWPATPPLRSCSPRGSRSSRPRGRRTSGRRAAGIESHENFDVATLAIVATPRAPPAFVQYARRPRRAGRHGQPPLAVARLRGHRRHGAGGPGRASRSPAARCARSPRSPPPPARSPPPATLPAHPRARARRRGRRARAHARPDAPRARRRALGEPSR